MDSERDLQSLSSLIRRHGNDPVPIGLISFNEKYNFGRPKLIKEVEESNSRIQLEIGMIKRRERRNEVEEGLNKVTFSESFNEEREGSIEENMAP